MQLRLPSGFSSARAVCISVLFILLALMPLATGNALSLSAPVVQRLRNDLLQAHELLQNSKAQLAKQSGNLKNLQQNLQQAGKILSDSKAQIAGLNANLQQAQESQTVLSSQLDRLQTTYKKLTGEYSTLLKSFTLYRSEMQRQIKSLERSRNIAQHSGRIARTVAISEGIALIAGIIGVVIYLKVK